MCHVSGGTNNAWRVSFRKEVSLIAGKLDTMKVLVNAIYGCT
jgi:hypothetical protein